MNCFTCERNLTAYIDDELQNDTRLEVEAHLDTCDRCREEYETQLASWEAAGNLRSEPAPDDLWKDIEAELHQKAPDTTLEDLALIVRGLAGEVRDLRRTVDSLRQDLETQPAGNQENDTDRTRRYHQLRVWSETPSRVESGR